MLTTIYGVLNRIDCNSIFTLLDVTDCLFTIDGRQRRRQRARDEKKSLLSADIYQQLSGIIRLVAACVPYLLQAYEIKHFTQWTRANGNISIYVAQHFEAVFFIFCVLTMRVKTLLIPAMNSVDFSVLLAPTFVRVPRLYAVAHIRCESCGTIKSC